MQLVAQGAQDAYLTGKPEITFFKIVYRRHTAFAVESISQTLNGTVGFGNTVSSVISRNGDLVNNLLLEITYTTDNDVTADRRMGFQLIKECEIEIGGQRIDRQYSDWMKIWTDLTHTSEKKNMLSKMIDGASDSSGNSPQTFFVPLQFWFCRDNGLALPLIALQYHEVKLKVSFEEKKMAAVVQRDWSAGRNDTAHGTSGADIDDTASIGATLYADYVYLDTDERKKFAQAEHEYLIEQVQRSKESITNRGDNKFRLNFNHPVKELVWVSVSDKGDDFGYYQSNCETAKLVLNGHERMSIRDGKYFNYVQPYQHHTGCPADGCYLYSFALNPEKHQPSGTCNFSRIDNATLEVHLDDDAAAGNYNTMHIFAHNYNVLRIMSGMGGLAYSN
jgi:hypothetical protein